MFLAKFSAALATGGFILASQAAAPVAPVKMVPDHIPGGGIAVSTWCSKYAQAAATHASKARNGGDLNEGQLAIVKYYSNNC